MRFLVRTPPGKIGIITFVCSSTKGMRAAVLFPDGTFTEFGLQELVLEGHQKKLRHIQRKQEQGVHLNGS
jgi:hypothetical protein